MKKLVILNLVLTVALAVYVLISTPLPIEIPIGAASTPKDTPVQYPPPTSDVASDGVFFAPRLLGPADGSEFRWGETILLIWDTPMPLAEDEWYEVQLWREGEPPEVVEWVQEGTWKVEPQYYPGSYQWRIRVVRGRDGQKERNLSPPSETRSFTTTDHP